VLVSRRLRERLSNAGTAALVRPHSRQCAGAGLIMPVILVVAVATAACGAKVSREAASVSSTRAHSYGRDAPLIGGYPMMPLPGARQRLACTGATGAVVVTPARAGRPSTTLIFLHGWGAVPPDAYGAWITHLVALHHTVIFPVYQNAATKPSEVLANALAGIRCAYRAIGGQRGPLVVVGVTTGGALAADYAAIARRVGLPVPAAILAVYPGRNPGVGIIPPVHPDSIPPSTWVEAIAGPFDPVVDGIAAARTIVDTATRVPRSHRRYLFARDPSAAGPEQADPAAHASFWAPLDQLIAEVAH
jgi:acetyl esterase/lipase